MVLLLLGTIGAASVVMLSPFIVGWLIGIGAIPAPT
jgi:hypothetical protein